jgi:hypothetical protein
MCVSVCTYGPINSGRKNFGLIITLHVLGEFCGINFCKDLRVKTNTVHWVTSIYVYCYAAATCFGPYVPSSGSVFVLVSYVKTETVSGNVNSVICVPVLWCCSIHLGNVYVRLKVQIDVHGFICIL